MGAQSRGAMRPGCACLFRPKEGAGNAGCPMHPRSRVHLVVVERTRVTTSTPESPGIPARNGFTAYFALSPVIGLVCHRHRRNCFHRLDAGVEASGPHDFAVRMSALSSLAPPASTASRPTSVTIAKRPSESGGMAADIEVIWVGREQENFCKWDWTAKIKLKLKQIFVFRRSGRRRGLRYRSSANSDTLARRW
jgi:hypothetical protein